MRGYSLILAVVCDERFYAKSSVFDPSRVIAISNNSAWSCWYAFYAQKLLRFKQRTFLDAEVVVDSRHDAGLVCGSGHDVAVTQILGNVKIHRLDIWFKQQTSAM